MQYKISDGITQTILTKFLQCPQQCRFFLDGLHDPTKQENFRKGTIGHELMEAVYKRDEWEKVLDSLYEEQAKEVQDTEKLNSIFGIFEALMTCYMIFYKKDFGKIKYVTEQIFSLDFDGFTLRGKTDLSYKSGKLDVLMEHKFWSQISEDKLLYVLSLDFQTNFYALVYKLQHGKYPDRIDYNVVRIPQNKIKEAESSKQFAVRLIDIIYKDPKYYFRRVPVVPSARQLQVFETDLQNTLQSFKKFIGESHCSRNLMYCYPGLYLCEYAPICVSGSKAGFKTKELFGELK